MSSAASKNEKEEEKKLPSLAINHIAVSVPDIDAFIQWYQTVMGFELMSDGPFHNKRSDNPGSNIFKIYGEELREVKVAFMTTGNGVGIEVFEFMDPACRRIGGGGGSGSDWYARGGFFHICVTAPDPDALSAKVVEHGGSRLGEVVSPGPGIRAGYVRDPWGNVVELLSTSFERLITARVAGAAAQK